MFKLQLWGKNCELVRQPEFSFLLYMYFYRTLHSLVSVLVHFNDNIFIFWEMGFQVQDFTSFKHSDLSEHMHWKFFLFRSGVEWRRREKEKAQDVSFKKWALCCTRGLAALSQVKCVSSKSLSRIVDGSHSSRSVFSSW